jgi:hypothetical protein
MALHESTGLRNKRLSKTGGSIAGGSLYDVMDLGFILIYDGPVPADADAALTVANHLLVTISNNSTATGIKFEDNAVNGALAKKSTEVWSGVVATSGVATFYRHIGATEAAGTIGALSTVLPRIQGECGVYGSEMDMTNTSLTAAATQPVDYYYVGQPTL